jgi:hypothetical protein
MDVKTQVARAAACPGYTASARAAKAEQERKRPMNGKKVSY